MKLKKIAAVAASLGMLFSVGAASERVFGYNVGLTASADYEFEFVDEEDDSGNTADAYEEADDGYAETEDYSTSSYAAKPVKTFNPVRSFFISLIIGLVAAFIVVSIMKSSMKSVHQKTGASDYRKENSIKLRVNTDSYLGEKRDQTPIARVNTVPMNNPNIRK